jgi:methylated-DNA-[protein]-cysteine S-methyltransferase
LRLGQIASPIGDIVFACDEESLVALDFADGAERLSRHLDRCHPGRARIPSASDAVGRRLAAYFDGDLAALDGIVVAPAGTPFERAVWAALRQIPAGATMTYGALAARLGRPAASRAVGHANGQNPAAIVIPCHRLIGADGRLTGYAGGLDRKRWLLRHEGAEIERS